MHDPARDATVDLRGLTFHYREYPGGGRPLALLHGVASSSRIWLTVGPLLKKFRPLALDQRGHGESAKPDSGYDFPTVVGDLAAFVEAMELERPVIVGHSWGGNVAVEFAATHPDVPAALILVDGGFLEMSARPGMTWEKTEKELAPPDLMHLTAGELVEMAKRWELGPIWSEEIEASLLANFEIQPDGKLRPNLRRENHMQVVRALWDQKLSELCPHVRCPVLYIAAEREGSERTKEWIAMKREGIERASKHFRQCEVRWMPDTIHDIPLHRPRELAAMIEEFVLALDR